jgi:hypothetical protein
MVREDLLKLSDTLPPDCLDIDDSGDPFNFDVFRKLDQEPSIKWVIWVNDLVGVLRVILALFVFHPQTGIPRDVISIVILVI